MSGATIEKSPAPAVTHAARILKLLSAESPRWLGISEIARQLHLSKASTHRFLHALSDSNLLMRHPADVTYTLGPALIEMGAKAAGEGPVLQIVREALQGLATASGMRAEAFETSPDGGLVCVASCPGSGPISLSRPVGSTISAMPTIGHLELAWRPDKPRPSQRPGDGFEPGDYFPEEIERVRAKGYSWAVAAGENTPRNLAEIASWLEEASPLGLTRRTAQGRAAQLQELARFTELRKGADGAPFRAMLPTIAIAAPVFDADGDVRLRLMLISLLAQVRPDQIDTLGDLIRGAGQRVTAAIGGRAPANVATA